MEDLGVAPAFWAGKRVLVTGHTGFKGAWLTLWLHRLGAEVTGFSDAVAEGPTLFSSARLSELASDLRGDVRSEEAVAAAVDRVRPEIILHLAAQAFVRRSYVEPVQTYATNVMGTVHVLEAARRCDSVRAVVVVTSDKCYDNRGVADPRPFVEDDPMGGHDPYSNSKGAAELVTDAYRRSFFTDPDGTRVASGRAGNVIGGGDWGEDRLIPDFVRGALAGASVEIRNPQAVRPWQHVLNPLSGYLMLAQRLHCGESVDRGYNFGPDPSDARPVCDVVALLGERWPGGLRWHVSDGPHPHEAGYLSLDSTRAHRELGWAPRWRLDDALDSIVDWCLADRDGGDMQQFTIRQIECFEQVTVQR